MRITEEINLLGITAHGRGTALRRIVIVVHDNGGNLVAPRHAGPIGVPEKPFADKAR